MSEQGPAEAGLTRQTSLAQILREMTDEGSFKASVLVSSEGLPLSWASSPFNTDTMAAMVALVKNSIRPAREKMGLDDVDEVSIVQRDKMRLVCRYFVVGDEELILAVVAPPHQTYRRLTNRAISRITRTWRRFS